MEKRVKVRDMKPGWTYTMPDKTIEELFNESNEYISWPPPAMDKVIANTGLFLCMSYNPNIDGKYGFALYPVEEVDEITQKALRPGQSGTCQIVTTGNKIWEHHPNYSIWIEVDSLDFEMIEAHPFPIARVENGDVMVCFPNPWKWKVAEGKPSRRDNYVNVWDDSDLKILIVLGLISFVLLMGGTSNISILAMIWLVAFAYIHKKHKKEKERILKERERNNVRGSGLDHKFKW